ncbi:unnamed protein product [Aphanomyces euteiches]
MPTRARCASNISRAHHVLLDQLLEEEKAQPNMFGSTVGCSAFCNLYGALIVDEHIDG